MHSHQINKDWMISMISTISFLTERVSWICTIAKYRLLRKLYKMWLASSCCQFVLSIWNMHAVSTGCVSEDGLSISSSCWRWWRRFTSYPLHISIFKSKASAIQIEQCGLKKRLKVFTGLEEWWAKTSRKLRHAVHGWIRHSHTRGPYSNDIPHEFLTNGCHLPPLSSIVEINSSP